MSYCRFSSDGFRSDVYCYESVEGGYMVHVAGNRMTNERPLPPHFKKEVSEVTTQDWLDFHNELMEKTKDIETESINGPFDGETFVLDSLEEVLSTLEMLKLNGYVVPSDVFESIIEDLEEMREKDEHINYLDRVIETEVSDPIMIKNMLNNGMSLMYRPSNGNSLPYFHAQVGAEEPDNFTLSTHTDPGIALCMAQRKFLKGFNDEPI